MEDRDKGYSGKGYPKNDGRKRGNAGYERRGATRGSEEWKKGVYVDSRKNKQKQKKKRDGMDGR